MVNDIPQSAYTSPSFKVRWIMVISILSMLDFATCQSLMTDLDSNSSTTFNSERTGWSVNTANSNSMKICASTPVMGGYGGMFTDRLFSGIPAHQKVTLSFKLWLIDPWAAASGFTIYIKLNSAANPLYSQNCLFLSQSSSSWSANTCQGQTVHLLTVDVIAVMSHSASTLFLGFYQDPSDTQMAAVREIVLSFSSDSYNSISICNFAANTNLINSQSLCQCIAGQYLDLTYGCLSCDVSCKTCSGPFSTGCIDCQSGYFYNGFSCNICYSSCAECTGALSTQCLSCKSGFFLYNNMCGATCPYPFTQITALRTCQNPCNTTVPYYYQNNTCNVNCKTPFVLGAEGVSCNFTCVGNTMLYQNGSCIGVCPRFINITQGVERYCNDPCYNLATGTSSYLYADKSCLSTCSPLFLYTQENVFSYCDSLCQSNQFTNANGSCTTFCDVCFLSGFQGPYKVCLYPDLFTTFQSTNTSCIFKICTEVLKLNSKINEDRNVVFCRAYSISTSSESVVDSLSSSSVLVSNILFTNNPTTASLNAMIKVLLYFRYMNITSYSALLLAIFRDNPPTLGFLPLIPAMSDSMKNTFVSSPLPGRFGIYKLDSVFLVNFWKDFLSLIICCAVSILFVMFECSLKPTKKRRVYEILKKMRMAALSFLYIQFQLIFGDLLFFLALQIITNPLDGNLTVVSFITSLFFIMACVGLIIFHLYLISIYQNIRRRSSQPQAVLDSFSKKYSNTPVFFQAYKDSSKFRQSFLLIFLLRLVLINLIIGLMYDYPLGQAILLLSLTILMLAYMLWQMPFKSLIDFSQQLFTEAIMLTACISVLQLSISDGNQIISDVTKERWNMVLIMCNKIVKPLPIVATGLNIIVLIFNYYKKRRSQASKAIVNLSISQKIPDDSSHVNLNQDESLQASSFYLNKRSRNFVSNAIMNRREDALRSSLNQSKEYMAQATKNRNSGIISNQLLYEASSKIINQRPKAKYNKSLKSNNERPHFIKTENIIYKARNLISDDKNMIETANFDYGKPEYTVVKQARNIMHPIKAEDHINSGSNQLAAEPVHMNIANYSAEQKYLGEQDIMQQEDVYNKNFLDAARGYLPQLEEIDDVQRQMENERLADEETKKYNARAKWNWKKLKREAYR